MLLSQDKIRAISMMCHIGAVTKRDCGRHTFRWLVKNGIGTHKKFWIDVNPVHSLSPNHKATYIMSALHKSGAFDFGHRWRYRYQQFRAMRVEV